MGPLYSCSGACCTCFNSKKIGISYKWTWVNTFLTIAEIVSIICLFYDAMPPSNMPNMYLIVIPIFICGVVLPLALIQFLKQCKCCQGCCCSKCCPVTERSYLDPNHMDELKYLDVECEEEYIEMEP